MPKKQESEPSLSRRERQIMDILYAKEKATGPEIQEALPDAPNYSTVRTILRILERKGHVRHIAEGQRYIYQPAVARDKAKQSAIKRLIATFFDGSAKAAAAAFLDPKTSPLTEEDFKDLQAMIQKARKEKAQ